MLSFSQIGNIWWRSGRQRMDRFQVVKALIPTRACPRQTRKVNIYALPGTLDFWDKGGTVKKEKKE